MRALAGIVSTSNERICYKFSNVFLLYSLCQDMGWKKENTGHLYLV